MKNHYADEIASRDAANGMGGSDDGSDSEDDGMISLSKEPTEAEIAAAAAQAELDVEKEAGKSKFKTSNPNDVKVKNIKLKDMNKVMGDGSGGGGVPAPELSRKERDAIEADRKKAAYEKLHKEGKTDEAKKDMERLALIKKRREEEAEKRKEVDDANAAAASSALSKAHLFDDGADDEEEDESSKKLDTREVKAMNPKELKEALKARGLGIQGSKKDLLDRLLKAAC